MTIDEIKSQRAKAILGDPIFKEVLASMEEALFVAWRNATRTEVREETWHRLKAVGMLREELDRIAIDGDVSRWNRRRLQNTQP